MAIPSSGLIVPETPRPRCGPRPYQLDEGSAVPAELSELADRYPGSWLKYLVDDTIENGQENKGVNPKYRPRGYNEGPKKDE